MHFLLVVTKLHLHGYCETIQHAESKECLSNLCIMFGMHHLQSCLLLVSGRQGLVCSGHLAFKLHLVLNAELQVVTS